LHRFRFLMRVSRLATRQPSQPGFPPDPSSSTGNDVDSRSKLPYETTSRSNDDGTFTIYCRYVGENQDYA